MHTHTHAHPQTGPTPHSGPPRRPTRAQQVRGCRRAFPRMNDSPHVTRAVAHEQARTYRDNTPPRGEPPRGSWDPVCSGPSSGQGCGGTPCRTPSQGAPHPAWGDTARQTREGRQDKDVILMDPKAPERDELFSDSRQAERERARARAGRRLCDCEEWAQRSPNTRTIAGTRLPRLALGTPGIVGVQALALRGVPEGGKQA